MDLLYVAVIWSSARDRQAVVRLHQRHPSSCEFSLSNSRVLQTEFTRVRAETERRAEPLSLEDRSLQSMSDCSPTKWHLAHTTWFFETFVLAPAGFPPSDARYGYLWNSYYDALGPRHARPHRGLLSRPSSDEVARYRAAIGIGVCQHSLARDEPELVPVLPDEAWFTLEMWVVTHEDLRGSRRVRRLFDHLVTQLGAYARIDGSTAR